MGNPAGGFEMTLGPPFRAGKCLAPYPDRRQRRKRGEVRGPFSRDPLVFDSEFDRFSLLQKCGRPGRKEQEENREKPFYLFRFCISPGRTFAFPRPLGPPFTSTRFLSMSKMISSPNTTVSPSETFGSPVRIIF